jgi:PhoH-like ATPase
MKKNYVLDTNVLLHDPQAIFRFEDNNVVIPIYAIEEVDQFKREGSERGRNARSIARLLDELRDRGGSLSNGVMLDSGGMLGRPTVFVTMDTNLRIRADALGMVAQTYENQRVALDQLASGIVDVEMDSEEIDAFFRDGRVVLHDMPWPPNTCLLLRDRSNPSHTALGRFDAVKRAVVGLRVPREGIMGVRPRNKEQSFAIDLLLDESIRLVTLVGKAGTGKTLLALAAGLKRAVEDGAYTRMLVSRPVMPLGRDIGFLPGDVDEKLNPWMQPIFDNLEFLFSTGPRKGPRAYAELLESGQIQVEPLTYIRGRSLPQQFMVVDEAQNLTPHEVKTIITRSGDGTKIVLTGDPGQIDNPYVDSASNGLTIAAERFRGEKLAAHIVLAKGERSDLAELAANMP